MHFRCHLGVTLVSTDKEFFENDLAFKLTNFCIVIEKSVLLCNSGLCCKHGRSR